MMNNQETLQPISRADRKGRKSDPRLYIFQALTLLSLASPIARAKPAFAQEQNQSFWGRRWGGTSAGVEPCRNKNGDQFVIGEIQPSGNVCEKVENVDDGLIKYTWKLKNGNPYVLDYDPKTKIITEVEEVSTFTPESTESAPVLEPTAVRAADLHVEQNSVQSHPSASIIGPWLFYVDDVIKNGNKTKPVQISGATGFRIVDKINIPETNIPLLGRIWRGDYYKVEVLFPNEAITGYMSASSIRMIEKKSDVSSEPIKTQPSTPIQLAPSETSTTQITEEPMETIVVTETPPPPKENTLAEAVEGRSRAGLEQNLPYIVRALKEKCILTPRVLAYALATIGHETASTYQPIEEYGGAAAAIRNGYDGGANYFGRGFIQLTHRSNYARFGALIGVPDLADNPSLALDPEISAKILATYFVERGVATLADSGAYVAARRPINPDDKGPAIAAQAYLFQSIIEKDYPAIEAMATDVLQCN